MAKNDTKPEEAISREEAAANKKMLEEANAALAEAKQMMALIAAANVNIQSQAEAIEAKRVETEEEKARHAANVAAMKEANAHDEELVRLKLFKDSNKYKNDVFVSVNGERYQIQRGKVVEVPRKIFEAIQNSLDQDEETANLIEEKEDEFKEASKERGL